MTVPPCPDCGRPSGLYYAECVTCWMDAATYTFADYDDCEERR